MDFFLSWVVIPSVCYCVRPYSVPREIVLSQQLSIFLPVRTHLLCAPQPLGWRAPSTARVADFLPLNIKNVGLCSNLAQDCFSLKNFLLVAAVKVPLLASHLEEKTKYVVNLGQVSSEVYSPVCHFSSFPPLPPLLLLQKKSSSSSPFEV